jgi:hypothetical protein
MSISFLMIFFHLVLVDLKYTPETFGMRELTFWVEALATCIEHAQVGVHEKAAGHKV